MSAASNGSAQITRSGATRRAELMTMLPTHIGGYARVLATSAVTVRDQVACDPRRVEPNRRQIIQPLDVQIARAVTPGQVPNQSWTAPNRPSPAPAMGRASQRARVRGHCATPVGPRFPYKTG